tara:strand:- start:8229 stop:8747 length:519 start_codon:yes stop_codon:yes gene_type:complete
MVVAEVLTGVALVKSSVAFIKEAISLGKDVNSIMSAVDDILDAEQEINAKRSKKDGMSIADQFGIKTVAHEVIDAKLVAEERYRMSVLIDNRFGHGTFKSIVDLRAQRIQEAKEHAKIEAKKRQQRNQEIIEIVSVLLGIILLGGLIFSVFVYMAYAMQQVSPSFEKWNNGS